METEGGSQLFETQKREGDHEKWAAKRGRVTQICAPDHVEAHPQKTKEVLYFVKKKQQQKTVKSESISKTAHSQVTSCL